ncbi:MAG: metallophosphoesterase [Polyangia bacterium]
MISSGRIVDDRLFIVGDVQGCADELDELLALAKLGPGRKLALAGDLINRGPRSRAVLERAVAEDALVVLGNHEDGLLKGKGGMLDRVREELGTDLPRWLAWIGALPTYLSNDELILVHAGIPPGKRPEDATRGELTRIRDVDGKPWFDSWQGPETVVFGHWSVRGKVDLPLVKGLDTGCVYGGKLTGLYWPECRWLDVPARRMWFDPIAMEPKW